MGEKRVQTVRDQAATLVNSGETVRHAVPVTIGPLLALALGPIGVAFLKFRTVVLTDRSLYVMTMKGMGAPKEVEQELPLESTSAHTGRGSLPMWSKLVVGEQSYNVGKPFKAEAQALAAAVSSGSPAAVPSTS